MRHFDFAKGSSYPFSIPEHPVHDLAVGSGPAREIFAAGKFVGLAVLDPDPPKLIQHLPFGSGSVLGLAASDASERLVMQNVYGRVFVVDTASQTVIATVPTPGLSPTGLILHPDGRSLFVAVSWALGSSST